MPLLALGAPARGDQGFRPCHRALRRSYWGGLRQPRQCAIPPGRPRPSAGRLLARHRVVATIGIGPQRARARALVGRTAPCRIRDFVTCSRLDARFTAGYRNRADSQVGRSIAPRTSIEDLSRAIAFDPKNVENHLLRAEAYLASANPASALKDFNRVIEMPPRRRWRMPAGPWRGERRGERRRLDRSGQGDRTRSEVVARAMPSVPGSIYRCSSWTSRKRTWNAP